MSDCQTLLAEYFKNGSEPAFRELVERYINLVYGAAVRLVDGDTHLAQDVVQMVFADLARLGREFPADVMLGGWLHRHTCFVAAKTMRGKRRREARERQAAEMNSIQDHTGADHVKPVLDEAIDRLTVDDRTAIVLRFFEQKDFRSVGAALGSTEEAARKRVDRALEKLQGMLKRKGVTISAGVLAAVLAGEIGATAAPLGLAVAVSGAALAGASASAGAEGAVTFIKLMTLTKLKVAAAFVAAGMATAIVIQVQSNARLQNENQELRQKLDAEMAAAHSPSTRPAQPTAGAADDKQLNELLRLRNEVTGLKRQLAESARPRVQEVQPAPLSVGTTNNDHAQDLQYAAQQYAISKMQYDRQWLLAFHMFAGDNQGQFPTNLDQALPYVPTNSPPDGDPVNTNHTPAELELLYQGSLTSIRNPASTIVLRGRQPWRTPDGGWANDYGFADGHGEIHKSMDGSFAAWEGQHMQLPSPTQ